MSTFQTHASHLWISWLEGHAFHSLMQGYQSNEYCLKDINKQRVILWLMCQVRISRKRILESAAKVFEMYGASRAVLEIEYFGEVGTGLGPTLEFYTMLSHDLQRKGLGMWRGDDSAASKVATGASSHHRNVPPFVAQPIVGSTAVASRIFSLWFCMKSGKGINGVPPKLKRK